MEPELLAAEILLWERERIEPEIAKLESLVSQLEAETASLRHGLGVVQQELQDLAELPGHWRDDAKESA